jgi:hypothetical protein
VSPHCGVERRPLDTALEDARVLSQHLAAQVSRDLFEGRVDVLDGTRGVGHDDGVARLLDRRGQPAHLEIGLNALGDVAPDREQAVAIRCDLEVDEPAHTLAFRAGYHELDAVLAPVAARLDHLAEQVKVWPAAQVGHPMRQPAPEERFGGATDEHLDGTVGEDDAEVADHALGVPDSREDQERVRHRIERVAHGCLGPRQFVLESGVLPARGALRDRTPHGRDEGRQALLEHVIRGTRAECLDHQLLAEHARDKDAGHGGVPGVSDRDGRATREAGQGPVGEDQLWPECLQLSAKAGLAGHEPRLEGDATLVQRPLHELGVIGRVLDEQNPQERRVVGHKGTLLRSSQYSPSSLTACMNCSKSTGLTM